MAIKRIHLNHSREVDLCAVSNHTRQDSYNDPDVSLWHFKRTYQGDLKERHYSDRRNLVAAKNKSKIRHKKHTKPITAEMRNLTQSIGVKLGFFFSGYKTNSDVR